MKLKRYIIKNFILYFLAILISLICIVVAIDYVTLNARFSEASLSFFASINFAFLHSVITINALIPICILISTIICFGRMNNSNEIIALKSSGINDFYLLKPVITSGIYIFILVFLLTEFLVPKSREKFNFITTTKVHNKAMKKIIKRENVWLREKNIIAHIGYYNSSNKTFFDAVINILDDKNHFKLIKRLDAKKGVFVKKGEWILFDIMEENFQEGDSLQKTTKFYAKKKISLNLSPNNLERIVVDIKEMSLYDLYKYIKILKVQGIDAKRYKLDFFGKIVSLFLPFLLSVLGFAIAIKHSFQNKIIFSIMYGLAVVFFYWVFNSFCIALGFGEILPPHFAAFISIFILILFSSYIFLDIN